MVYTSAVFDVKYEHLMEYDIYKYQVRVEKLRVAHRACVFTHVNLHSPVAIVHHMRERA